jgi:hypothetical protein
VMPLMTSGFRLLCRSRIASGPGSAGGAWLDYVPGVAADGPYFIVGVPPFGDGWISVGLVALECRAVLDCWDVRPRTQRIAGRTRLCNGGTCGNPPKRQENDLFHGPLDVEARAMNARNRRAEDARRLQRLSEGERWTLEAGRAGASAPKIRLRIEDRSNSVSEVRLRRPADRRRCATSRTRPAVRTRRAGVVAAGETRLDGVIVLVAIGLDRLARRLVGAGLGAMMIERPALRHRHGEHPLDGHHEGHYEQQQKSGDGSHCGAIVPQDAVSTMPRPCSSLTQAAATVHPIR